METPILSICIPSYNRVSKVISLLPRLLAQLGDHPINVIVLDNCSSTDYLIELKKDPLIKDSLETGRVSVVRNRCNIGMSGNFLRAFEIATGHWMWLLSDDDDVRPEAIETILNSIQAHGDDTSFIKFSSVQSMPEEQVHPIDNLAEFVSWNAKSYGDFNGFLFISNGIYHVGSFLPFIGIGYHYAYTYIPHFMMLVSYINSGKSILVLKERIVDYVRPDVGYSYGMVAGIGVGAPKNMLLKVSPKTYRGFLGLFFPHNDFKVVIDLFYQCQRDSNLFVCAYLIRQYAAYSAADRNFIRTMIIHLTSYLVRVPRFFEFLVNMLAKSSKLADQHIKQIRSRYSDVDSTKPVIW